MRKTDTPEKGLESLIMRHMTGTDLASGVEGVVAQAAPAAHDELVEEIETELEETNDANN